MTNPTQAPSPDASPTPSRWRRFLLGGGLFTPRGMLSRAAMLLAVYVVLDMLGWREDTSILSGSVAGPGQNVKLHAAMGMVYAASYFAAVVLVPILAIASGVLWGLMRWLSPKKSDGAKLVAD